MALTQTGNYREEIDKLLGQYVDAIKRQTANNLNSEAVTAEGFFRNFLNLLFGINLSKTKLTGQEKKIQELLDKKVSYSAIGRILGVHRLTVSNFVKERMKDYNI